MRDPHVVTLRYLLVTDGTVSFDNPPAVEWETDAFRLRLEDGIATVQMLKHFPTEKAAKERVEPYLRDYEVHAALSQYGRQEFRFEFDNAGTQVIDRNPPRPGSPQVISVSALGTVTFMGSVSFHVTRRQYPSPPGQFVLSPDAETFWHRYEGYLNKREPLPAMAYACLSLVEASAIRETRAKGRSKREKAANLYSVEKDVLDKLGELSGEQFGDNYTARKFDANRSPRPHTAVETAWVEAAIRKLILQVGQWAAGPDRSLPKLTMDDLPPLEP